MARLPANTTNAATRLALERRPGPNGCIEWTGGGNGAAGYGQLKIGPKMILAHRAVFELAHGAIPQGMMVLHSCDNRRCINVDHLSVGTHADNMADRGNRDRTAKGEESGLAKLNDHKIREIRRLYATGHITQASLAEVFEVTPSNVSLITSRLTWIHVL